MLPRALLTTFAALTTLLVAQDGAPRLVTSREAKAPPLQLPKEEDAFGFVVFGDRTGGPKEGIEVLRQAVADTNLLDPDLVLTVGDLINGYNGHDEWHAQAAEYKAAMAQLRMPWFPVAGNHDVYWRGPGKPAGEHERDFEAVFGPLWYAFRHKQCWFVVLYSDEGDPQTGRKDFEDPACQRISDAQFAWLRDTLQQAKGARHVFVFLHHPRWLTRQYGDDWNRVHTLLAANGNVTAVFAGHIHRMRFDGVRDGIQYYTVASVGAYLEFEAPQAGFLHQYHVVTVRPEGITVAALPVGGVLDPQAITGELSEDVDRVHTELQPRVTACEPAGAGPAIGLDGAVDAVVTVSFANPAGRAIELEVIPAVDDGAGFAFAPDHQHLIVAPGSAAATTFLVRRTADPAGLFALPQLTVRCDYLAAHRRVPLPPREFELPLPPPAEFGRTPAPREGVLLLDGKQACLAVAAESVPLPDGPFTLEAWVRGERFTGRTALVAKTDDSDYALFGSDGAAEFSVFLAGADGKGGYVQAEAPKGTLQPGRWHHVAGVFDGQEVRCYVDGELRARAAAAGTRRTNAWPLFIGADPNGQGKPMSRFAGAIDEVRLSRGARYAGERFAPPARHTADADTLLLLHLDADFGPWTADASGRGAHARRLGTAHCSVESRPAVR
ncbi:MAG: metallophosphoesterase [Planctomycetes bacterium]|nr:metallophosphoesterase [Planctomycetota bacterium]